MSKKVIMAAAAAAAEENKALVVPLRSWIDTELEKTMLSNNNNNSMSTNTKESIIRKVTVAYGIVELILRFNKNDGMRDQDVVQIDNFAVHVHVDQKSPLLHHRQRPWDDIKGVSMINPDIALTIEEPAYLSCFMEPDEKNSRLGRCLEVEQMEKSVDTAVTGADAQKGHDNERRSVDHDCYYLVAKVLHELLTHEVDLVSSHAFGAILSNTTSTKEPASKKAKSSQMPSATSPRAKGDLSLDKTEIPFQTPSIVRMQHLGFPASLCLLIESLLESALRGDNSQSSNDAYKSMKEVAEDLHLLLLDPERFLFDHEVPSTQNMELRYRKGKLYGRDKEETLITDAFCRVSRGKSEAFLIGGFSGCGKSMLVNSLRARVNVVGGYVITHKFDNVSQERSLAGIISAANQLCLMLRDRNTPQKLALLTKKVMDEFGADAALLVRILKDLRVLSPEFVSPTVDEEAAGGWDKTDARSVGFTLLRFLRLISTPEHPVMLFLDDLQWADESAFDAIHTLLSDTLGSCIFFVGTYRDNEVDADHLVFDLIKKLEMSHVPTSKSLTGLKQEDLNTMISDALCLYPRICMSLTNIVSRKTGGNPYFVLEFMQSLQSRGLLQYNFHQRRWVWDEAMVGAEEITDNVLHLLSSKMSGLSDMEQLLLKVMACFGTYMNALVIGYLSESPEYSEYSGVQDGLETVIGYGFVENDKEGGFKFVHDKVREAAYNLIPESDKKRFHYNLGKALHSVCEEKDVGDTILLIASQINHGAEFTLKDDVLRIPIVKLNMAAGKRAFDCCRHETAYRYLKAALALLPNDHWDSHYDFSLRLSFMVASAANSSCKCDEAEQILRRIVKEARCTKDKVPSYFLLGQIFHAQGKVADAYDICSFILKQLGETDPESIDPEAVKVMIPETLKKYDQIYGDDWLAKKMEDSTQRNIIGFYGLMATSAYFCKAPHILAYITCKGVEKSLEGGVCVHTPLAILRFCVILDGNDQNVARAHLIAKNAMELSERLRLRDQIPELNMLSFVAVGDVEGYRLAAQRLRACFDSALSSGNANIGFMCATQSIQASVFSGEKELTSLLKEIDYYLHQLETYKSEVSKNVLLSHRETVSLLVDRGEVTGIEAKATIGDENDPLFLDLFYCQQVFRNFWLGYGERCRYFAQKGSARRIRQRKLLLVINFYHGLVLLDMIKNKMNHTLLKEVEKIIESLKVASTQSDSSYRSKAELLQAELQGISAPRYYKFHNEAVELFDAAIASAKSSKFIHEQGLACEKAGLYYKKMGLVQNAVVYLQQALSCYKEWGSSVKVQDIQRKLNGLNVNV